jgi:hypothetical protein
MFLNILLLTITMLSNVWAAPSTDILVGDYEEIVLVDASADKVKVQLLVVHATTKSKEVDPRLKNLLPYFSSYKYSSFKLIKEEGEKFSDKSQHRFVINGQRILTITLLSHDPKRARMKVVMTGAKGKVLLDTVISVNRNGTFIVAGPKYQEGILFLPITASY